MTCSKFHHVFLFSNRWKTRNVKVQGKKWRRNSKPLVVLYVFVKMYCRHVFSRPKSKAPGGIQLGCIWGWRGGGGGRGCWGRNSFTHLPSCVKPLRSTAVKELGPIKSSRIVKKQYIVYIDNRVNFNGSLLSCFVRCIF